MCHSKLSHVLFQDVVVEAQVKEVGIYLALAIVIVPQTIISSSFPFWF